MVKTMQRYKALINGQLSESSSYMDVVNPATGQPFAQMGLSSPEQVDEAIKAAQKAFPAWSKTSDEERKNLLHQVASLVEENMPELMALITKETGKPLQGLHGIGAGMEVGGAAAWIHLLPLQPCQYSVAQPATWLSSPATATTPIPIVLQLSVKAIVWQGVTASSRRMPPRGRGGDPLWYLVVVEARG